MRFLLSRATFLVGVFILTSVEARADTAQSGSGSVGGFLLLETLSLLVIVACLLTMLKVYGSIRGGKVGNGWLWFILAFGVLGMAQLLLFGGRLGVVPTWDGGMWIDILRLISLVLLLVGVTRFRKLFA